MAKGKTSKGTKYVSKGLRKNTTVKTSSTRNECEKMLDKVSAWMSGKKIKGFDWGDARDNFYMMRGKKG